MLFSCNDTDDELVITCNEINLIFCHGAIHFNLTKTDIVRTVTWVSTFSCLSGCISDKQAKHYHLVSIALERLE